MKKQTDMNDLNSVTLEGIVKEGPWIQHSKKGETQCSFLLEQHQHNNVDGILKEQKIYVAVKTQGRQAKYCCEHLSSSKRVRIVGRLIPVDDDRIGIAADHVNFIVD